MSRVIYTETVDTREQQELRAAHGVRLVSAAEEGTGVNHLPAGVYGFTYSTGLPNAPLFSQRRYRSYEVHKAIYGEVFVIGFVTATDAQQLVSESGELGVQLHPDPRQDASILVTIPYSRIRQHRQHAAPNQDGFAVTITSSAKLNVQSER